MLFLLNEVILNLGDVRLSPRVVGRRFRALPFDALARLGQELYAEDPLLHHARPERAQRLASLIVAKAPPINAALFLAPAFDCAPAEVAVRFANIPLEVMIQLYRRQEAGLMDTVAADKQVWRRLAA